MTTDREEALLELRYYWENYGDIERQTDWREKVRMFPDIERAWRDYQHARMVLELILKNAS